MLCHTDVRQLHLLACFVKWYSDNKFAFISVGNGVSNTHYLCSLREESVFRCFGHRVMAQRHAAGHTISNILPPFKSDTLA